MLGLARYCPRHGDHETQSIFNVNKASIERVLDSFPLANVYRWESEANQDHRWDIEYRTTARPQAPSMDSWAYCLTVEEQPE
jgi:hypothetical protein